MFLTFFKIRIMYVQIIRCQRKLLQREREIGWERKDKKKIGWLTMPQLHNNNMMIFFWTQKFRGEQFWIHWKMANKIQNMMMVVVVVVVFSRCIFSILFVDSNKYVKKGEEKWKHFFSCLQGVHYWSSSIMMMTTATIFYFLFFAKWIDAMMVN